MVFLFLFFFNFNFKRNIFYKQTVVQSVFVFNFSIDLIAFKFFFGDYIRESYFAYCIIKMPFILLSNLFFYRKLHDYILEIGWKKNFCIKTIIFSFCMFFKFENNFYYRFIFKFFCFSIINEFFLTKVSLLSNLSNMDIIILLIRSNGLSESFGSLFIDYDSFIKKQYLKFVPLRNIKIFEILHLLDKK